MSWPGSLAKWQNPNGSAPPGGGRLQPGGARRVAGVRNHPGGGRRDGGRPGEALGAAAQAVVDQELLDGRLAHLVAAVGEPIGVLAAADRRLGYRQGEQFVHHVGWGGVRELGLAAFLGLQRLEAVGVGPVLPFVVAGAGDTHLAACLGDVPEFDSECQQAGAPVVDDLVWGHGGGSFGSVRGTTGSTTVPSKWGTRNLNPRTGSP